VSSEVTATGPSWYDMLRNTTHSTAHMDIEGFRSDIVWDPGAGRERLGVGKYEAGAEEISPEMAWGCGD
jgi:hypothetical protein